MGPTGEPTITLKIACLGRKGGVGKSTPARLIRDHDARQKDIIRVDRHAHHSTVIEAVKFDTTSLNTSGSRRTLPRARERHSPSEQ
jgi:CO dehydrogenase nickel-insertion accessory protein CooC1